MKNKKKPIIIASAAVVVVAILVTIFSNSIVAGFRGISLHKYLEQDLETINTIKLVAHSIAIEDEADTLAGVKEAVRQGANGVVVDICFKEDGTPVMCSDYNNVDSSPLLEDLFKNMNGEMLKKADIFLNIIQLSELTKLNKLAVDYDIVSRLYIIGIDEAHYGLISGDDTIIPFFLNYTLSDEEKSAIANDSFTIPEVINKYNAFGLVLDLSDCNAETIQAFDDYGVPVMVTSIEKDSQLCDALTNNAKFVYVNDAENSREILDQWTKKIQKRYEKSVEHSLEELSEKN